MRKSVKAPGDRCDISILTADGTFTAHYSAKGLAGLDFPKAGKAGPPLDQTVPAAVRAWHRVTESALNSVLAGKPAKQFPPLDLSAGTEFQQSVWRALLNISTGATKSYGEIAGLLRRPKAVRAVGGACGANPIPVLIPCHRVLAANRQLGGFSGGLDWKRRLLARERIAI